MAQVYIQRESLSESAKKQRERDRDRHAAETAQQAEKQLAKGRVQDRSSLAYRRGCRSSKCRARASRCLQHWHCRLATESAAQ